MERIKHSLNRVIGKFGYRLIRSPDPKLPFVHNLVFDGFEIPFWLSDSSTKSWWFREKQKSSAETEFLKRVCTKNSIAFDVGAHHGYQSLIMAFLAFHGEVHAFEANPICALTLDANIGLNKFSNVFANTTAIGAKSGSVEIRGQSLNSISPDFWVIPMISLDEYRDSHSIPKVDILKIDVEGFEGEVLKGAKNILSSSPHINLELHLRDLTNFGWNARDVLDLLPIDDRKYEVTWIDRRTSFCEVRKISSFDHAKQTGVVNLFFINTERMSASLLE